MESLAIQTLLLDVDALGAARLTLNRPDAHDALHATVVAAPRRAADRLAREEALRATVLAGATFCAGGDTGRMPQDMGKTRGQRVAESAELASTPRALRDAALEPEPAHLLRCAPEAVGAAKQSVAWVNGHALPTSMLYGADTLADARGADEGIEAFFAERKPAWRQD